MDEREPIPFDDALRQILKAPPKKSPKGGKCKEPREKPPKDKKPPK